MRVFTVSGSEVDAGEARDMEALEGCILATLGVADPYAQPRSRRAASRAK